MTDPPDLTADPRALRVTKRPIPVAVEFAAGDGVCTTLEGPVQYRAGDALLTGVRGERWPVRHAVFVRSYVPVPPTAAWQDGGYVKRPSPTLALRLTAPMAVAVGWQHDPLQGHPGDWLLRYADGDHAVIDHDIFLETYEPAAGEDRWPPA